MAIKTKAPEKKTLRELRKEIRYTQKEVSEGAGIPFSTYVAYEHGYRNPSLKSAQKLADFYKCRVEDITFNVQPEKD